MAGNGKLVEKMRQPHHSGRLRIDGEIITEAAQRKLPVSTVPRCQFLFVIRIGPAAGGFLVRWPTFTYGLIDEGGEGAAMEQIVPEVIIMHEGHASPFVPATNTARSTQITIEATVPLDQVGGEDELWRARGFGHDVTPLYLE
ncbi:hypothetical protein [Planctomicrobium sp. SH527]|uniref:hypothetical protein n=1 Tax=Planctomicrobium sp. SH527 TaxID=3448123 RepID=UPI003F5C1A1E